MRKFLLSLSARYQILFIMSVTVASAFIVSLGLGIFFDTHQLIANTELTSSIYQVMGTIYAILLTFTLWGIWQNYTDVDEAVQKEAFRKNWVKYSVVCC